MWLLWIYIYSSSSTYCMNSRQLISPWFSFLLSKVGIMMLNLVPHGVVLSIKRVNTRISSFATLPPSLFFFFILLVFHPYRHSRSYEFLCIVFRYVLPKMTSEWKHMVVLRIRTSLLLSTHCLMLLRDLMDFSCVRITVDRPQGLSLIFQRHAEPVIPWPSFILSSSRTCIALLGLP